MREQARESGDTYWSYSARKHGWDTPFSKPMMECRECGKPIEGHGRYCNPVVDRAAQRVLLIIGGVLIYACLVLLMLR